MDEKSHETTERRLENLVFHRFEVQNKIVYYLLAINAACIGFTVNFTKDLTLTYKEIPIGLAILLWLLSFYFGIAQIQNHEVAIQLNINELAAYVKQEKISDYVKNEQILLSIRGRKLRKYQNFLMLFGVICFIIWRVYKII
jgi:hypothetical protein